VARLATPSQGVRQITRPLTEGPGSISSPGSLPAPRVACRCSSVGFDWQHFHHLYHHIGNLPCQHFSLHATVFGSLSPILRDLDSRLGGCGVRGIDYLFFQICLKKCVRKIQDYSDPQLDSSIQPKARGLLHMECDFSIAHRIRNKIRGMSTS
jgi:hypothetical protein